MEDRPKLRTYSWRLSARKGAARALTAVVVAACVAALGGYLARVELVDLVRLVLPSALLFAAVEAGRNALKQL